MEFQSLTAPLLPSTNIDLSKGPTLRCESFFNCSVTNFNAMS